MTDQHFEAFLARMPDIARAIEPLPSEAIQMEAFRALVQAFNAESATLLHREVDDGLREDVEDTVDESNDTHGPTIARKKVARKASAKAKPSSFSVVKDLDFVRGADQSLADFVAAKEPTSNMEKCLIILYWLQHRAEVKPVMVDHVYSGFRAMTWKVPTDLVNTLQKAGSKGWIDSSDREDLKVVIGGDNYVEHDMPAKKDKRS